MFFFSESKSKVKEDLVDGVSGEETPLDFREVKKKHNEDSRGISKA